MQLPTELELVREFGVSRPTIRNALAILVDEGLLRRFPGRGTFVVDPEQTFIPADTSSLNIQLISRTLKVAESTDWLTGALGRLHDYHTIGAVSMTECDWLRELELLQMAIERGADGVVLHPSYQIHESQTLIRRMGAMALDRSLPMVLIGQAAMYSNVTSVWIDDEAAGYTATKHLIDLGHERIAHIGWLDNPTMNRRTVGYKRAMTEAGLAVPSTYVIDIATLPREPQSAAIGGTAGKLLLGLKEPPTAIFAYWTELAAGAMFEAMDQGLKVPDDMAFIGMDAGLIEATRLRLPIPISRIWMDMHEIGRTAIDYLLRRIGGEPNGQTINIPHQLHARQSTTGTADSSS